MRNTLREHIFAVFAVLGFFSILIGAIAQNQIERGEFKKAFCTHYNPTIKAVCQYKMSYQRKA